MLNTGVDKTAAKKPHLL